MNQPLNVVVILGTARDGRRTPRVIPGIVAAASDRGWNVTVLDVADDPQTATNREGGSAGFRELMSQAEAFVLVVPEYNNGYPGELKMLLDRQKGEFKHKPVGIVGTSGGRYGGARVTVGLLPVLFSLRAVPVAPYVLIGNLASEANPFEEPQHVRLLDGMLNELEFFTPTLRRARSSED